MNLTARRRQEAGHQTAAVRTSVTVTLVTDLVAEARELGVNVSQAAEADLAAADAQRRQDRWLAENEAALVSSNAYIEQRGLPLAKHRMF